MNYLILFKVSHNLDNLQEFQSHKENKMAQLFTNDEIKALQEEIQKKNNTYIKFSDHEFRASTVALLHVQVGMLADIQKYLQLLYEEKSTNG